MKKVFQYGPVKRRMRNHLPHLDTELGRYFVTFCLFDALPPGFLSGQRDERAALRQIHVRADVTVPHSDARRIDNILLRKAFAAMDRGTGSCLMREPGAARIVAESLCHFDGQRYRLYSYSVMPSHVHVAFRSFAEFPWWRVVGDWKSFTAKQVNRLLGRQGTLWQDDNFDRLIRDNAHLERVVNYIMRNPDKAGLHDWPWVRQFIGPPYDD